MTVCLPDNKTFSQNIFTQTEIFSGPSSHVDWEDVDGGQGGGGGGAQNKNWEWDTAENARTKERMKKMKDHMK